MRLGHECHQDRRDAQNLMLSLVYQSLTRCRLASHRVPSRRRFFTHHRFVDWFARQENEPALRAIIEQALAKKTPREWEKILDAAGAPCASIWKIEEVIDHPQISARRAVQEIDTPYGRLRFAGSGFQLAHGGGRLDSMAPALSAHTDEVLNSLGYAREAIADLRAREIV